MTDQAWASPQQVSACHRKLKEAVAEARRVLDRPLRLVDKILAGHVPNSEIANLDSTGSVLSLTPDRLAMPDSSAQMALLQFMSTGLARVALPSTVHCDHLVRARSGAVADLAVSHSENVEVYEFLASASARFGIGLWEPGSGIIHQVLLERYAYPGGFLLGADSHTPNAGGLGMLAIGVGGAQAVDVMVGRPFEIPRQKVIGIELVGSLDGFASAKDVILRVAQELTVSGGTGAIIEYFGPGVGSLSATGRATICNMGAELGATTSIFPPDERSVRYLEATGRHEIAELAAGAAEWLAADEETTSSPSEYYDQHVRIDLSDLSPQVVGPHSPDRGRPLSALAQEIIEEDWPDPPAQALIGSCTNSSYEDIGRAADIARQAAEAGLKVRIPLLVTPGSEAVRVTVERDGLLADLEAIGATVLANACGPCIGQWARTDIEVGERNSIITSFNRNFPGRNDGSSETLAFIASPEVTVAMALGGTLGFDPARDRLPGPDGDSVDLVPPDALDLPPDGFSTEVVGFVPPRDGEDARTAPIAIDPDSERLQLLEPFPAWTDDTYGDLPVLLKVKGKCTTDHISPAGRWLRFRGHIDRISDNMFLGANNVFTEKVGHGVDQLDGAIRPLHEVARHYKSEGINWVVIGDENYGEGSSREHAAMEPRYLGCIAVVAKSFARIHETNLKKHGVLPLRFVDGADHGRLGPSDRLRIGGLSSLRQGDDVLIDVTTPAGDSWTLRCSHSLSDEQIEWFHAGSALNSFAAKRLEARNKED